MKTKLVYLILLAMTFLVAACGNAKRGETKVIKSTRSNNLTVTLSSASGELKSGDNDLRLSFTDEAGKLVEINAASLNFHMPAMGAMAEMNDEANLTTSATPGEYRAQVNIEVAGTWEAIIIYESPQGKGRATMTVNAK
ncbi:MAG: FixH family protein [Acidobacteriota bacterium]